MSINGALYNGVTGLGANSKSMSIIANNIANANTKSFKSDRAEFADMFTNSNGNAGAAGLGTHIKTTTTLFNQGALANTGQITDLSIQGDGFFMVKNAAAAGAGESGAHYTRQGSFRFDSEGNLVDMEGERVQGYMPDSDNPNRLATKTSDLKVSTNMIPPHATSVVNISANLDAREKPPVDEFNPAKTVETSNYSSPVSIYDSLGNSRQATIHYVRSKEADKNAWQWFMAVDGSEVSNSPAKDVNGKIIPATIAKGRIEFDANGKPVLPFQTKTGQAVGIDVNGGSDASEVKFVNGAKPQKIQVNFGPPISEEGKVSVGGASTSLASQSEVGFHSQDGFEAGYMKSLKVGMDGSIRAAFTNGLERRLGAVAVAVATFQNNQGLSKVGRNNYAATPKAGEPQVGFAQTGSKGSIYSGSLEESNIDLAQQFVDMIVTQRAFQANSKSITTSDSMLEEIVNLKR